MSITADRSKRPVSRTDASAAAHPGADLPLGATYLGEGRTAFNIWAPRATSLEVVLVSQKSRAVALERVDGYHRAIVSDVLPGTRYLLRFPDGRELPDPASRFQPEGVHRPSAVVDPEFGWTDADWRGVSLADYIIYELHVGTFSDSGTFDGVIERLDALVELGITAIEIMPVAQFPGGRNWGYDGVHLFAVQNTYGGPAGLKRLVDAAHARGLAVVLDVVYNHLGPEGNYLNEYAPYFTDRYHTPWGSAVNFDGVDSDEVRRYFISNALEWVTSYKIDALRLDAIHAIVDESAQPFLMELAQAVRKRGEELGRRIYTIAESSHNNPHHVWPVERGGFGLDAQWNDDLEHALRVSLTGNADGYYCDFAGIDNFAKSLRQGFVLDGVYSAFRRRRHGAPPVGVRPNQLVVFSQNHDQVGNRPCGERLCHTVDFESTKLAAATVLLSPYLPLLFMGEEYAETAPFLYFVDHTDPGLLESVRKGRREEFIDFIWPEQWPDPCCETTFEIARLDFSLRKVGQHAVVWRLYQELIRLRKSLPTLADAAKDESRVEVVGEGQAVAVYREAGQHRSCLVLNLAPAEVEVSLDLGHRRWKKLFDSADARWDGPGTVEVEEFEPAERGVYRQPPRTAVMWGVVAGGNLKG